MSPGAAFVLAAGDDQQKAAPLGLFVLLLLGLACYFLFRSMSRHLKRIRDDFPIGLAPPGRAAPGRAASGPAAPGPAASGPTAPAPTRPATSDVDGRGPDPDDGGPPALQ